MLTRIGFQHPCRNWAISEFLLIMLHPQVSEALTPHPRSSFVTTDGDVMDGDTTESQNRPKWREQMTTGCPVPVDMSTVQPHSWALGNIVEGKAEKWLEPENQKSAGRLCLLAMTGRLKTQLPKQDLNNGMSGHTTVDGGLLQGSTPRWRGTGN